MQFGGQASILQHRCGWDVDLRWKEPRVSVYIIEVACVHLSNFCWIMRVDESGDAIGMLQMWSLQEAHTHSYTIRVWVAARRIKLACK